MALRLGQGFDVHAFEPGDHVMLCGLAIPHNQGLKAHSDGDVALHALADALLGALALGDIGHYFPDTDPQWKGADSATLLKAIYADLLKAGWQLGNADLTIICQAPKLAPHITPMRQRIADILDCTIDQVSVKATTTEKLGFTGRKEGIAVQAAVLIESR